MAVLPSHLLPTSGPLCLTTGQPAPHSDRKFTVTLMSLNEYNNPHPHWKEAKPVPPPEQVARALGYFQWTCPNCGQEHPFGPIPWRQARMGCRRCKRVYRIGLGFRPSIDHAAYLLGRWQGFNANRWKPTGTAYAGAKLSGTIEWQCHECLHPQRALLGYDAQLSCESCSLDCYISVLFYSSIGGLNTRCPFDWIVKGLAHAKSPVRQPVDAPQVDSCPGTSS